MSTSSFTVSKGFSCSPKPLNTPSERLFMVDARAHEETQRRVQANGANFSSFVSNLLFSGNAHTWRGDIGLIAPDTGDPMPVYRQIATRLHPLLFSLVARRWVTESTNGFRAVRTCILADPRLDLSQTWLRQYELEPYLYLRSIQLGYRTVEVPVTKIYPPKYLGQTKMKPIVGWWSILRPLVYVGFGLRK